MSPNSLQLHRLTQSSQFEQIVRQGKKVSSGSLVFKHMESPDGAIRLAFVVRKKCGNAVFRNRVRRILRQQFYAHFSEVPVPFWAMIQFFGNSKDFSANTLHAEADGIMRKLGWIA